MTEIDPRQRETIIPPGQEPADQNAMQSARQTFSDIKQQASEDIQKIKDFAEDKADEAIDATKEMASRRKNFIARELGDVGSALEKVGTELRNEDHPDIGSYAADLGRSARTLATDLENRDIGEIASMAEDFARRQPIAFLGLAAIAGFAASRFITASATRREAEASPSYPSPMDDMPTAEPLPRGDVYGARQENPHA